VRGRGAGGPGGPREGRRPGAARARVGAVQGRLLRGPGLGARDRGLVLRAARAVAPVVCRGPERAGGTRQDMTNSRSTSVAILTAPAPVEGSLSLGPYRRPPTCVGGRDEMGDHR